MGKSCDNCGQRARCSTIGLCFEGSHWKPKHRYCCEQLSALLEGARYCRLNDDGKFKIVGVPMSFCPFCGEGVRCEK